MYILNLVSLNPHATTVDSEDVSVALLEFSVTLFAWLKTVLHLERIEAQNILECPQFY